MWSSIRVHNSFDLFVFISNYLFPPPPYYLYWIGISVELTSLYPVPILTLCLGPEFMTTVANEIVNDINITSVLQQVATDNRVSTPIRCKAIDCLCRIAHYLGNPRILLERYLLSFMSFVLLLCWLWTIELMLDSFYIDSSHQIVMVLI